MSSDISTDNNTIWIRTDIESRHRDTDREIPIYTYGRKRDMDKYINLNVRAKGTNTDRYVK